MHGFPDHCYLDKNKLNVDTVNYQRDTGIEEDIFKNWTPRRFQTLEVNKRPDGTYWVVEGGNRTRAAQRREDVTVVPVNLHNLSFDEEVILFHQLDAGRKALTEKDKLKGKVKLNQPDAVLVNKLINKAKERKIKTPENIKSYLSLAKRNPNTLERVWDIVLDMSIPNRTIRKRVIRGLFLFETNSNEGEKVWTDSLLKTLKEKGADKFNEDMSKTGINVNTGSDDLTLDAAREVINNWKVTH